MQGHGIYIDKCMNRYEGGWKNDRAQGCVPGTYTNNPSPSTVHDADDSLSLSCQIPLPFLSRSSHVPLISRLSARRVSICSPFIVCHHAKCATPFVCVCVCVCAFGDRYGAKIFAKGDRHEGMYRDDKRNGWGKYVWANGDKYIGEWHQGMMHGRGTFSWQKVRARARGRPFLGVVVL